ncbi:TonB-dependent receptor [Methylophaga sp.]|uniref:TonB-dependent receptor n=1 Tax=Methylophaga sp. TaxID=2024840 RepID=UPI00271A16FB|nr:TonB-dependent receptor [Methylophaga sp.]MDO8826161.1 TonB-dependent receptor [Methylophaga sp.]
MSTSNLPRISTLIQPSAQVQAKFTTVRPLVLAMHLAIAGTIMAINDVHAQENNVKQSAGAQADAVRQYDIPAGPLSMVLTRFSTEAGIFLVGATELAKDRKSPGVRGRHSVQAALTVLLAGTGLEVRPNAKGQYVLQESEVGSVELPLVKVSAGAESELPPVFAGGQVARGSRMGILGNVDVFDTPFSTQSFTEEFARDQQARRVSDIVSVDPSVRSAMAEYGDTETFMVRGFPLFTSQVGVNGLYGMTDTRRISPEFYERVDLLKGPASMLYGVGPFGVVGGNLNLVSKRAGDDPLTRLTGSYVSDSQFGGHLDVARRFGDNNAWGVRANLLKRDGDTPIDRQQDSMSNQALALDYRGSKLKVSLDLTNQERLTDGQTANMQYNQGFALPKAPDNDHNFANSWEFIDTHTKYWMAAAEYEFDPAVSVYANYGQAEVEEEYFYAASSMRRIINNDGDFTARVGGFRTTSDVKTYEVGLRGQFDLGTVSNRYALTYSELDRSSKALSVHASGVYTGNIYETPNIPKPILNYDPLLKNGDLQLSSVGLLNTFGFMNDTILLTLGARDQKLYSGVFSSGIKSDAYEESKVTPLGALLFKSGNYSFYVNYSEGLAQGATAPSGTENQGEFLSPSVTEQYEGGIKYDAGNFGVTAAVFQIKQPNTFTNSDNVFAADGEQRNRGLELSIFGQPIKGMRLLGGFTYINAEQTKTQNGVNDGNDAIGIPRFNVVLNGEYDIQAIQGLTLTSRITAFSEAQADVGNTQSIQGWGRFDLGGRYVTEVSGKALTFHVNLINVADKSYWNSVSRGFITSGAPRTLLVSTSIDF